MNSKLIGLLFFAIFGLGILGGYYIPKDEIVCNETECEECIQNECEECICEQEIIQDDGVYIRNIEDNQIVHSKILIDAALSSDVVDVEVKVNGKKISNYVPYIWNNLQEPAGKYEIEVKGTKKNANFTSDKRTVIIPEYVEWTMDNFTCKEDFVVHANQTCVFRDGVYNFSDYNIENGINFYNIKPYIINIFGNLSIINSSISMFKIISTEKNGFLYLDKGNIFCKKRLNDDKKQIMFLDNSKFYAKNNSIVSTECLNMHFYDNSVFSYESGFSYNIFLYDNASIFL